MKSDDGMTVIVIIVIIIYHTDVLLFFFFYCFGLHSGQCLCKDAGNERREIAFSSVLLFNFIVVLIVKH